MYAIIISAQTTDTQNTSFVTVVNTQHQFLKNKKVNYSFETGHQLSIYL